MILLVACGGWLPAGCETPPKGDPVDAISTRNEAHARAFGDFELPRKLGAVENIGLQMPAVSPDGTRILYLRTDAEDLSPLTLLGSSDPVHTPGRGTLSIWIRPLEGGGPGERLSPERWAHSPAWSDCSRAVCYVANEPPGSAIVLRNLAGEWEAALGMPGLINCMPRFDGDDRTILFCAGLSPDGPMRIFRQSAFPGATPESAAGPIPVSPQGFDCILPAASDVDGSVLCVRTGGEYLHWVRAVSDDLVDLASGWGTSWRPGLLQVWSGIHEPMSPNRRNLLFYDSLPERITVWHRDEQRLRRHRPGSIAACWLTDDAIALATSEHLFAVETNTGMSLTLFNGAWIPCRYIPSERRLILLAPDIGRRLAIYELSFRSRG